jgi:hypothetical protein
VITAREAGGRIHALLNDSPFTLGRDHEGMKIELKSIGDAVIIDFRRQAARAHEAFSVKALPISNHNQLFRGLS